MISKVLRQRKGRRSLRELLDYILAEGKAKRVLFNPILVELSLAADLMEALAKKNHRVKQPFYHLSLAWPNSDMPTEQEMEEVMQGALQRLGMLEHQWVAAIHDDAGHPHIHAVVNLVHPDTFRCASTSYDFFKLGQYATEVERRYGWMKLRRYGAPGAAVTIGRLQLYERDLLPRARGNGRPLTPTEAAFQKWLRDKILMPFITAVGASDACWHDALAEIGRYGVHFVPSAGGARFVDAADSSISIAASLVARVAALPQLEKYLGAFEDIIVPIELKRAFSRSAAVLGPVATEPYRKLLSQYRFEKRVHQDQARVVRHDAWAAQRAKEVAERARIREQCTLRLRTLRHEPKAVRQKARPQILAAKEQALEYLKRQHKSERKRLRAELSIRAKPQPWSKFVDRLVGEGNSAAVAYVQSTRKLTESDRQVTLFPEGQARAERFVAGGEAANTYSEMPPSVAAYESLRPHAEPAHLAPDDETFDEDHLPAEIPVRSIQEDVEAARTRLQQIRKSRTPKLTF